MGLFDSLFRSNPISNLTNPQQWLIDMLGGGGESESGVNVNADTIMSESAIWCGINFIASNVGSLPCPVMLEDGKKKIKQKDHYLYKLLNNMANPEMTSMVYRETCLYYQLLWGTAISIKVVNKSGEIVELWPVHPDRIGVIERVRGRLKYTILLDDGTEKKFDQEYILRVPGLGTGLMGLSLLDASKNGIGLSLAMRQFANLFFKNGSNMGVIFSHPDVLGETAHKRLTKSLATSYSGLGNSHKAMVAEEGMTVTPVGVEPEKSQLLESRQYSVVDVARWLNLPPHVLKDLSQSNYSNIQHQGLELVTMTFRPIFIRLEQSWEAFLLRDFEKGKITVRHNANGLLRGDDQARGEYYKMRFATGSITPNEIKILEDENPFDGEWADKTYLQLNLIPAEDLSDMQHVDGNENIGTSGDAENIGGAQNNSKKSVSEKRKSNAESRSFANILKSRDRVMNRYIPILTEGLNRIVAAESKAISAEIEKQSGERADNDFNAWVESYYSDTAPALIDKNLRSAIESYSKAMQDVVAGEVDVDIDDLENIDQEARDYLTGYVIQYIGSSMGQVFQQYEDGGVEAVQVRVDEWKEKRLDKELGELSIGVGSMAARSTILGAGYRLKWKIRGKTCPMCKQLDGRTVSKRTETFTNESEDFTDINGRTVNFRQTLYSPLHKGCDCLVVAG